MDLLPNLSTIHSNRVGVLPNNTTHHDISGSIANTNLVSNGQTEFTPGAAGSSLVAPQFTSVSVKDQILRGARRGSNTQEMVGVDALLDGGDSPRVVDMKRVTDKQREAGRYTAAEYSTDGFKVEDSSIFIEN